MEDYCNNGTIVREFKFPSPAPTPYDDVDHLVGKHIWKFRIRELLGVGAFSNVFLAHNMEEGGLFAVKMINKERMYQDLRVKSSIEREVGVLKVRARVSMQCIEGAHLTFFFALVSQS